MSNIQDEIAIFKSMQAKLEAEHIGQWVLIYRRELIGLYASFDMAADVAIQRFGNGPFLIRQVGAKPVILPASIAHTITSA